MSERKTISINVSVPMPIGSTTVGMSIDLELAREWVARRLWEDGEIEGGDDGDDLDVSQVDDEAVVRMFAADIGANLDYEKLR